MFMILVILNNNEVRLSLTEASSEDQARMNALYEYRVIADQITRLTIFPAQLPESCDFKEYDVHFIG